MRSRRRVFWALAAGVAGLSAGGCATAHRPPVDAAVQRLVAESRPIGAGIRFQPPVGGAPVGSCRARLGPRYGAHVEIFGANKVVLLPAGIGTEPPLRYDAGRISDARCYGDLVTVDPTGLVLVRRGARPQLSALFRSLGQPLSTTRVASFSASVGRRVAVFVGGHPWHGNPRSLTLRPHAEIVLEVGAHVPPHSAYEFPPGT